MAGKMEIEVKMALARGFLPSLLTSRPVLEYEVCQLYTDIAMIQTAGIVLPAEVADFPEWRIRSQQDRFFVTGKSRRIDSTTRGECEVEISGAQFHRLLNLAGETDQSWSIRKFRREFTVPDYRWDRGAILVIDDYREVNGCALRPDFVIVEIEVHSRLAADAVRTGLGFTNRLRVLRQAVDINGMPSFWNRNIAINGFPFTKMDDLLREIRGYYRDRFAGLVSSADGAPALASIGRILHGADLHLNPPTAGRDLPDAGKPSRARRRERA